MNQSLHDIHGSVDTTARKAGWRRIFSFMGPAYLVSVGYMDPGNWATDIAAGSKFGYTLIWVLLASNLMAVFLQSLSARLGIVRGRDLAQANRESFPRATNFILWILAELAIAATDLAEILGMAIGIQLLFGLPLMYGVTISILDTFILLYLQRLGIRKIEAFILTLIGVIGVCFLINLILAQPVFSELIQGFIPSFPEASKLYAEKNNPGPLPAETALYLAIGMIGATVMPHNLYLHSSLIQTRKIKRTPTGIREALKWSLIDSTVALNLAFFINAAILILAATVFFNTGRTDVGEISRAHELLSPVLGSPIASTLFAVALIASGQSSTITGTMSGQIVMEGYLRLRINPIMRRLITRLVAVVPAVLFIWIYGESHVDQLLVFSQVILSVQLAFAIIPLIHFVSDRQTMQEFTIGKIAKGMAWIMASVLVYLNASMLAEVTQEYIAGHPPTSMIILIGTALVGFAGLLCYVVFYPLFHRPKQSPSIRMHQDPVNLDKMKIPSFKRIAIALDFSDRDAKVIAAAIGQSKSESELILIHVVETALAQWKGNEAYDFETKKDQEHLDHLVAQLNEMGYKARGKLGYNEIPKEIARIVQEENADLLVIGAHGHQGLSDFIYGATINAVRHELNIPVHIVHAG
jgi:manganese transport protein